MQLSSYIGDKLGIEGVEIEKPGAELLPEPRRLRSRRVPSAKPGRRGLVHRHEDLPIPAPHPAALHAKSKIMS
jgi:hypothetical protein